jgi:hypothetical protein
MRNTLLLLTLIFTIFACNTKHDYPADVTQNFMNSCQMTSGGNQEICSCLLDKIQKNIHTRNFHQLRSKCKQVKHHQISQILLGKFERSAVRNNHLLF